VIREEVDRRIIDFLEIDRLPISARSPPRRSLLRSRAIPR
jgi:hypothetical protein